MIDQFVFTGPNAHTNGAVKVKAQSPPLSARSQATSTGGDISDGSWSDSSEVVGGTKTGSVIEGR